MVKRYLGPHQVHASDEPELANLGLDVQLDINGTSRSSWKKKPNL